MIGWRVVGWVARRFPVEQIGPDECPLMFRWTLSSGRAGKLLLHLFPANVEDLHYHDHPRPFVTLVLVGRYTDLTPDGTDELRQGMLRFRRAGHMHKTATGRMGALTLVVMGPQTREWGFLRDGRWWPFREYLDRFGGNAVRCQ
jgi:hypothetical protein